jgi:hypothetical protein
MHKQTYNIYCDESCHLQRDGQPVMVLGAVWCLLSKTAQIASEIREIKKKHGLPAEFEIKWTKVRQSKADFYHDLINYFFDEGDLHFRALVAHKDGLRPADFQIDHDGWYYRMYFDMLKVLLSPTQCYRVYLDIKDTKGGSKVRALQEVLRSAKYDFRREIIEFMQIVESHHVEQMQLADLLIGCVSYANRNLSSSSTKVALVEQMRQRSKYSLLRSTLLREQKVNLFHWQPKGELQG